MNVKYGMQYYTLSVVLPYFYLIHGFDSFTRSNGGISTGEVKKIKYVCQVLKLMSITLVSMNILVTLSVKGCLLPDRTRNLINPKVGEEEQLQRVNCLGFVL